MSVVNKLGGTRLGRKRDAWGIRREMWDRGLTQKAVAAETSVSQSLVSKTIQGLANNRRVLETLLRLGIPSRLLALPDDMQDNGRAA